MRATVRAPAQDALDVDVGRKSFTSTLIGLARAEGKIASFDDPVTKYLPELAGTGYDGVRIRHILEMSSGIDFNESYEWVMSPTLRPCVRDRTKETFADAARSFGSASRALV
jgi:CubicO group peptidase (beta-lactamase class C family)